MRICLIDISFLMKCEDTSIIIKIAVIKQRLFQTWYKLDEWTNVGQLLVTVHGAKGLSALNISGNVNAFCVLELDNSRIQTHTVRGTSEPNWNKSFTL